MSSTARATAPSIRPAWRPRLHLVRSPEPARSVVPFLVLCMVVLAGSLVAALLLNTSMAVSSYRVHAKQVELAELRETQLELQSQLDALGSPGVLRERAGQLGMVPPEATVYVSVGSGTIFGGPQGDGN